MLTSRVSLSKKEIQENTSLGEKINLKLLQYYRYWESWPMAERRGVIEKKFGGGHEFGEK